MIINRGNIWRDYKFEVSSVVTHTNLEVAFLNFWNDIILDIEVSQFVLVQFKVLMPNDTYRSISYVQTINYKDCEELLKTFKEFWDTCSEEYHQSFVKKIIFTYKILDINPVINKPKINVHKNIVLKAKPDFSFKGRVLPNNMDFLSWGIKYEIDQNFSKCIVWKSEDKNSPRYKIQIFDSYTIIEFMIKDRILFTFKDTLLDPRIENPLYSFTR